MVGEILELIEAGDCYQVNFTIRTEMGAPLAEFLRLRRTQKAGWGGLLSTGNGGLVSCSPELFFALDRERIWARPMKGSPPSTY
ncbi:MAG: chorismate-binding protein [Novosphingobium sp.]